MAKPTQWREGKKRGKTISARKFASKQDMLCSTVPARKRFYKFYTFFYSITINSRNIFIEGHGWENMLSKIKALKKIILFPIFNFVFVIL